MTPRRRKALIVSAVVLGLLSLFWFRLDSAALKSSLSTEMAQYSSLQLQAERTSLAFMHGIGLRLDQVTLDHPDFQMQAKHINISIRLLPLLLGKTEVNAIDMHDAVFKLKSDTLNVSATSISSLPIDRLRLIRSRIETANGNTLINNLQLELRGIGSEHETLWELNAQQDQQAISGHGRILFHRGDIDSSFGKLKFANMPVAKLHALAPTSLMRWIEGEGNIMTGSLTMDMTQQQTWAVFGEMLLENKSSGLAAKLRGKLSHPAVGKLVWKDSFIHLGKKAVIAIVGSCEQDHCSTTLDAQHIDVQRWHPFIPDGITFHRKITGNSDLKASLQWDEQTWQGSAALKLFKASFQYDETNIKLPVLHLDVSELSGNSKTWNAKASITSPKATGSIHIQNEQQSNGYQHLHMTSDDADSKLWQPLSNLLLASLNLQPTLQAKGKIQGALHIHQLRERKRLVVDIDATSAQINYAPWLKKEAQVKAVCQATIRLSDMKPYELNVPDCQLDSSHLTALVWSQSNAQQELSIDRLLLDFDSLQHQSTPLPEPLSGMRGKLSGHAQASWTQSQNWIASLYGDWDLDHLGTDSWRANGHVRASKGIFNSNEMHLDGAYGKAELKGSYDAAKQLGKIDINTANIDWNSLPSPPSLWQQISLRGNIKHTELKLLNNNWHDVHSNYKLSQGTLTLQTLQGKLADGSLSSDKLVLSAHADGLNIRGNMHGKNIQLDQVHGLNQWMQADLHGSLHANIRFNGRISQQQTPQWQKIWNLSNGDILIYSGDWKQQLEAESFSERLGLKTPALKSYAFKKLAFRFRIHANKTNLSRLELIRHNQTYRGKASISADLHLLGALHNSSDKSSYVMDSNLPQIDWQLQ